jgi:hypothetical protein
MLAKKDIAAYDRIFERTVATPEPGEVIVTTLAYLVDLLAVALKGGGDEFAAEQMAVWHTSLDIDEVFE